MRSVHVLRLVFSALFATLLISSSGIVCERAGDTRLSSLEVEILGVNRIVFDPMLRVYDLWLPAGATQATVGAVPMDPAARVTWYVPDGTGMLAGGTLGVGGGEVTVDLPPDGFALYVGVFPPEGARDTYIMNMNPLCPQGDPCTNGGVPGTCSGDVCETSCVPSGTEVCDDGLDNDCDGLVDSADEDCAPSCVPAPEVCDDGLDNDCDGFIDGEDSDCCQGGCCDLPQGTTCRAPAGPCDIAEVCDGISPTCPPDEFQRGITCRAAGICDVAENCEGSFPECPPDVLAPEGTPCVGEGTCQSIQYQNTPVVCVGAGTCIGDAPGLVFNGLDYATCLASGECESLEGLAFQCAVDVVDRKGCFFVSHLEEATNVCLLALNSVQEHCVACLWSGLAEDCSLCAADLEYLINDFADCSPRPYTMAECTAECIPTDEVCDDGLDNDCDGFVDGDDGDCQPLNEFGVITGDIEVITPTELDSTSPYLFKNMIDFGSDPYDSGDYYRLSLGAQQILGGDEAPEALSQAFAFEVLRRSEGAQLLKTESEIDYLDPNGKKADMLVDIAGRAVGVTAIRAVGFPPEAFDKDQAQALLENKLSEVISSTANVTPSVLWTKQVLHVFAYSTAHAVALEEAYAEVSVELRSDTIVLITVTEGEDAFLY